MTEAPGASGVRSGVRTGMGVHRSWPSSRAGAGLPAACCCSLQTTPGASRLMRLMWRAGLARRRTGGQTDRPQRCGLAFRAGRGGVCFIQIQGRPACVRGRTCRGADALAPRGVCRALGVRSPVRRPIRGVPRGGVSLLFARFA